ncbi:MAG: hypothetical protein K6B17_01440 [Treponema sp.]|nr:hypothetical protein [Treponema sp.]
MFFYNGKKLIIMLSLGLAFSGISLFSQAAAVNPNKDFLEGEDLFKKNKVQESIPYLKAAISSGKSPKAYVYLSLAYYQQKQYMESLEICSDGMKVSGTDKKVLAFNAGNTCFALEDYDTAEKWYSLAIAANRLYAPPVLNRANCELKQEKYRAALEDYKLYLDLSPNDRQKPEIEKLIALLEGIKKAEDDRIAEEERLKEEEKKLLEEMKRQQMQADFERQLQERDDVRNAELEKQLAERDAANRAALEAEFEKQRAELERMIKAQQEALSAREAKDAAEAEERIRQAQENAAAKAELEKKQAELDRLIKEQEKDREVQAALQKAELEKKQAELDRLIQEQKADREREAVERQKEQTALQKAEMERMQAELEQKMLEREKQREAEYARQKEEIEKMLNEQRQARESNQAAEALNRQVEEDAARRRKLLEDVASSLQETETLNQTAGAEGTIDYGYESELE